MKPPAPGAMRPPRTELLRTDFPGVDEFLHRKMMRVAKQSLLYYYSASVISADKKRVEVWRGGLGAAITPAGLMETCSLVPFHQLRPSPKPGRVGCINPSCC